MSRPTSVPRNKLKRASSGYRELFDEPRVKAKEGEEEDRAVCSMRLLSESTSALSFAGCVSLTLESSSPTVVLGLERHSGTRKRGMRRVDELCSLATRRAFHLRRQLP